MVPPDYDAMFAALQEIVRLLDSKVQGVRVQSPAAPHLNVTERLILSQAKKGLGR